MKDTEKIFFNILIVSMISIFSSPILSRDFTPQDRQSPFDRDDKNKDGKLSREEFAGPSQIFNKMDKNGDGYLSRQEAREFARDREGRGALSQQEQQKSYENLTVNSLDDNKVWKGKTLFVDSNQAKVVEIDINGKVLWEYYLKPGGTESKSAKASCSLENIGCGTRLSDVELLPNNNVLLTAGGEGVYEVSRDGKIVWSYLNPTVSHDADRLPNGNTLMACANSERLSDFPYKDPQVIEVNANGKIVWAWYAKDHYLNSQYKNIRGNDWNDWTHVNSVTRLADDNTMICIRNWDIVIAVNKNGETVWDMGGKGKLHCPHTPQLLKNGNLLVSEPILGRVVEYDPHLECVIWSYPKNTWRRGGQYLFIRDAQRLPNGNTFIVDSLGALLEVTQKGEIVWCARINTYKERSKPLELGEMSQASFFKADREGAGYLGGR